MALGTKKQKLSIVAYIGIVISIVGLGIGTVSIILNSIDKDSIGITINNESKRIEHIYGTELDLSDVVISYEKNKHNEVYYTSASFDMISDYNPEIIGHQTVTLTFKKVSQEIEIFTSPADIEIPTLNLNTNIKSLEWTQIEHASTYELLYSTNQIDYSVLTTTNDTAYDLSSFVDVYGPNTYHFAVKAIKESEKYNDSTISNNVSVKIIDRVDNIIYEDGLLTWSETSGASFYNVDVDGTIYENIESTEMNLPLNVGHHKITILSSSKDANSISITSIPYEFDIKMLKQVDFSLKNGVIYWNEIEDAESYDVYINNKLYCNTSITYVDLSSLAADVYKISVIAKNTKTNYYDSEKNEQYHLMNLKLNVLDDVVSWPTIVGNYKYVLYIDDKAMNNASFNNSFDLSSIDLTPGNHMVHLKVIGDNELSNDTSSKTLINKLITPVITIENSILKHNSSTNIKFFANNKEFSGNINDLKEAGEYQIYAISTKENSYDISSEKSNVLTITKHVAPEISIKDGKLFAENSLNSLAYYLNDLEFDGDLTKLDCGTFNISAINKGDGKTTLDSKLSNILVFSKLETPILEYKNNIVICTNEIENTVYVLDGINIDASEFNFEQIPDGIHKIKAYNKGLNDNEIESGCSDEMVFLKTTLTHIISLSEIRPNMINIVINSTYSNPNELYFDVKVSLYKEGICKIETQWPSFKLGSSQGFIYKDRNDNNDGIVYTADEVVIHIEIVGDFETYIEELHISLTYLL